MPSVNSKSVHEIKLNGGDIQRLSRGESIEVDLGDSVIKLVSKAEDFEQDDTTLDELEEIKEQADEEAEDKGDIVPENLEERDVGGGGNKKQKRLTNDQVKVGNKEENLSGMVEKK